jgi:hypothetical protein
MPQLLPTTHLPRPFLPTLFQTNVVPLSALQADPRFSYAAFIPDQHYSHSSKLPLLVTIHGTRRRISSHIEAWRAFATSNKCAILAPLFPALVSGPTDVDGYHFLGRVPVDAAREKLLRGVVDVPSLLDYEGRDGGEVKHDLVLLQMLNEVAVRWPGIETRKILLAGFSGGGSFAQRFMYLYPERLRAVSVGALGDPTLLDYGKDWPRGVKDVDSIFGKEVDMEALKRVPILASVGADDHGSDVKMAKRALQVGGVGGGEEVSRTRVKRLQFIVEEWKGMGLDVELEIVPAVGHVMEKVNVAVLPFMARQLEMYWKELGEIPDENEGGEAKSSK